MAHTDATVRTQGSFSQHVTTGGDEYVVDHRDNTMSGMLSSEEEAGLESGSLTLADIVCDQPLAD